MLSGIRVEVCQHWPLSGIVVDCSLVVPLEPTRRNWRRYSQRSLRQLDLRRQWLAQELEALINSILDAPIDMASDAFKAIERRVYWQIQALLKS